ncbi:DEAD/DEAH box helicase [Ventosimonas gracilis]|uniref:DEAD-box ATP-dependent RNA helicase RhpA n=1 Tax=Ventosimonas gracilis TaxID=1680762 RepID=A0A139SVM4_9GAMM|nr:DEAD/DEAH box helicase [Ventosimonas gracilis]KXU38647.1 DEAD/DEAH box helicase [Ventosimonas gracilis]
MSFASLGLSEALAAAVAALGYNAPTPVQQRAIPALLQGRDLMVAAQTGTGKTAGFALPILQKLFPAGLADNSKRAGSGQTRALVLTPTRELAAQVHDSFRAYAEKLPLNSAVVFGGVGTKSQVDALEGGLDVLVACPGRLLDLALMGAADLSTVEILVLDEADRMLDMGFIRDVKKILAKLPKERQNLLFSATFSNDISELAEKLLKNPERIEVTPPNTTVERIDQRVLYCAPEYKRALLAHLIERGNWQQVLVFARTKHGANRLAEYLDKRGLSALAIHGNKSQNARSKALADFKSGAVRVLVATDIAARGLDIDQLPHVVNFELPQVAEDYVHRIGRTGRSGRSGEALSLVAPAEEKLLRAIERLTRLSIAEGDMQDFEPSTITPAPHSPSVPEESSSEASEDDMTMTAREERPRPNTGRKTRHPLRRKRPEATTERDLGKTQNRPERGGRDKTAGNGRSRLLRRDKPAVHRQPFIQPELPPERDPEDFLDDDIDNFGNRADYVSPYQAPPRRAKSPSGKPRGGHPAQANGTASGGKSSSHPRKAGANKRKNTTGASANSKHGGRRGGYNSLMSDAPLRQEGAAKPKAQTRQPLIIHKESRLAKLRAQDQEAEPLRSNDEKPALLRLSRT